MAAQMVSPQTLKSRFWGRKEEVRGLGAPRRGGMVGEEGMVEVGRAHSP